MFDPASHKKLKSEIALCIKGDSGLLDVLRKEIRPLKDATKRIQPRSTTSISLVGTDGGNNQLQFDPFLIQLIRVVDSSNNEYCLEAVSPTSDIDLLSRRQFDDAGKPVTQLGSMMAFLGVTTLPQLSHMIRPKAGQPMSPSWVQVYRELVEWAILFSILREKDFGTDTLIVCDGLLRSKVFAEDHFKRLMEGIGAAIDKARAQRRRIYLVGVAKHSKVLDRYRLAMALEQVLQTEYPAYVEVPREIEQKSYVWGEFARGADVEATEGGEIARFVGGKMFLVKFGFGKRDPVWPVDIFLPQASDAQIVLGSLLADCTNGFPVPLYPMCLQKAHENAALVDFDFDILQDQIFEGVRTSLGVEASTLDVFRLQDTDVAQRRYS